MTTNRTDHEQITNLEREIITLVANRFHWDDLEIEQSGANIGPFALEKFAATEETETIGGTRQQPVTVWVLLETVFCSGSPSEPDYDDIAEFDEVTGSVWKALEALRLREKEHEIRNEFDSLSYGFSFQKQPFAEEY